MLIPLDTNDKIKQTKTKNIQILWTTNRQVAKPTLFQL